MSEVRDIEAAVQENQDSETGQLEQMMAAHEASQQSELDDLAQRMGDREDGGVDLVGRQDLMAKHGIDDHEWDKL